MRNEWYLYGELLTEEQIAAFTLKNAHKWYEASAIFTIVEDSGEVFEGCLDSIHREEAFQTAADYFNIDYDVIYNAWLDEKPILRSA